MGAIKFIVVINSVEYSCKRTVEKIGRKQFKQTIEVEGMGIEDDDSIFWEDQVYNGYMEFRAKRIAIEIISRRMSADTTQ